MASKPFVFKLSVLASLDIYIDTHMAPRLLLNQIAIAFARKLERKTEYKQEYTKQKNKVKNNANP